MFEKLSLIKMFKLLTASLAASVAVAAPHGLSNSIRESEPSGPFDFKIVTSNVRYAAGESSRFDHEKSWDERKQGQIDALNQQSKDMPTLIGVQEVLHNQLVDIVGGLNSANSGAGWTFFGVGRDDGVEDGEYAAVVYDNQEWELLNGTSKWLSLTPDKPSKDWDASHIRIVSITEMKHKKTGSLVNYLNTHYDQKSELARKKSSELIAGWMDQIPNDYPKFLSGDFNSVSSDDSYQTLKKSLADTREIAYDKQSSLDTYTGFEPGDTQNVIDFIWAPQDSNTPGSQTQVNTYNVIDTWTSGGFRFSDHRPVVSTFTLL